MLDYTLLGLLRYAPMTGYDLKQIMDQSTSNFWYAKQSQIYTTLKRMEQKGWVRSEVEEQTGRPDRRVYHLQAAGEESLQAWLGQSVTEVERRKEGMLVRLFFGASLSRQELLDQLDRLRELHQIELQRYRSETKDVIREYARALSKEAQDGVLWDATRRFGVLYEEMVLSWIDETSARIKEEYEDESE